MISFYSVTSRGKLVTTTNSEPTEFIKKKVSQETGVYDKKIKKE